YVTYQTAFVDYAGKPQYRADIYGLDKQTTAVLHGNHRIADVPMARNYSSGSKQVMAAGAGAHSREARNTRDRDTRDRDARSSYAAQETTGWNANPGYVQ